MLLAIWAVLIAMLYLLITVLCVLGNALCILIYACLGWRSRLSKLRWPLISLSLSDLAMGVFCIPLTSTALLSSLLTDHRNSWPLPGFLCPLTTFLQHVSVFSSVYIHVLIGLNRFRHLRRTVLLSLRTTNHHATPIAAPTADEEEDVATRSLLLHTCDSSDTLAATDNLSSSTLSSSRLTPLKQQAKTDVSRASSCHLSFSSRHTKNSARVTRSSTQPTHTSHQLHHKQHVRRRTRLSNMLSMNCWSQKMGLTCVWLTALLFSSCQWVLTRKIAWSANTPSSSPFSHVTPLNTTPPPQTQMYVQCKEKFLTSSSQQLSHRRIFTTWIFVSAYLAPLLLLAIVYARLTRLLCKHDLQAATSCSAAGVTAASALRSPLSTGAAAAGRGGATRGSSGCTSHTTVLRKNWRIIRMLATIVLLFAACWLPLHVFFLVVDFQTLSLAGAQANSSLSSPPPTDLRAKIQQNFVTLSASSSSTSSSSGSSPSASSSHTSSRQLKVLLIYAVSHWLAMANSFVNPCVYILMNKAFKDDLFDLIYHLFPNCRKSKDKHHPMKNSVKQHHRQHYQHHQKNHRSAIKSISLYCDDDVCNDGGDNQIFSKASLSFSRGSYVGTQSHVTSDSSDNNSKSRMVTMRCTPPPRCSLLHRATFFLNPINRNKNRKTNEKSKEKRVVNGSRSVTGSSSLGPWRRQSSITITTQALTINYTNAFSNETVSTISTNNAAAKAGRGGGTELYGRVTPAEEARLKKRRCSGNSFRRVLQRPSEYRRYSLQCYWLKQQYPSMQRKSRPTAPPAAPQLPP